VLFRRSIVRQKLHFRGRVILQIAGGSSSGDSALDWCATRTASRGFVLRAIQGQVLLQADEGVVHYILRFVPR